jgi:Flp pilus assembly protein TadD
MTRRRREKLAEPSRSTPPGASAARLAVPASIAAGLILWLPSLRGEFLYDDIPMVVQNPVLQDPGNIRALLGFDPARPLLTLSWVASALLGGGIEPWAFRLVNVVLHAATAGLVAHLALWLARARGEAAAPRQALLAGLFFAVTPMASETVAYVASRSTGLCAFFGFAFLALATRELEAARPWRRAAAGLLLLLAHLTKEEAAAFPLLLVLLDLHGPAAGRLRAVASRWRLHAPFLALPLAGLCARRAMVGTWLPAPAWPYDVWLPTQALEFPAYLLRALVPLDPAFHRGTPPFAWPPEPRAIVLALLLLALLAFVARRPGTRLAFAAAWMAAGLAPSSSLVPLRELAVDHRAYTGGFGAAWVVAGALAPAGRAPLAAATLAVMAARSLAEQATLATSDSAWAAAVERNPDVPEVRLGAGLARLQAGDPAGAERHFRRMTELTPRDARGWSNLASALAAQERYAEALEPARRAADLAPGDPHLAYNLGVLQARVGRLDLAQASFERAGELTPPVPQALLNLARIHIARGEFDAAEARLARAAGLRLDEALQAQLAALRQTLSARRAQPSP